MNDPVSAGQDAEAVWMRALQSALLFAAQPFAMGGIWLRSPAGPVLERWLAVLTELLAHSTVNVRRIPIHTSLERLLGGLDLSATLATGKPVMARGLLQELDGQVILLNSAERCPAHLQHVLCQTLDHGQMRVERDGMTAALNCRIGLIAVDEGRDDDEALPAALTERLGLVVDLRELRPSQCTLDIAMTELDGAAQRYADTHCDPAAMESLLHTAELLGVDALRIQQFALRAARASAALAGRRDCDSEDLALATQLVLAPRATRFPSNEQQEESSEPAEPPPPSEAPEPESTSEQDSGEEDDDQIGADTAADILLAAAAAALPPGLLDVLQRGQMRSRKSAAGGRNRSKQRSPSRGRSVGVIAGFPPGSRLALVDTLRAAAPFQTLRGRARPNGDTPPQERLQVRRSDFRAQRRIQAPRTTTIFAVDSSGSSAMQRLAEAKGAVENLLAECYVRRDQVALLTFRGEQAQLCLPPTRSLPRAKRALADLPGGGGTPIAAGLIAARELAERVRRDGDQALLVIFSDGRANVALDPSASRAVAQSDALTAARQIASERFQVLFIDTAPRPQPAARELADALCAQYLPLPRLSAGRLNDAIRQLAG